MKTKGFTLMELLAVIVILGVLALIATPLILNMVTNAREQAFLDSAYGIRDAAEYRYTEAMLSEIVQEKKVYAYPDEANILKVKGEHPDAGQVVVEADGRIALALWSEKVRKCVVKSYEENKVRFDEAITKREECATSGEKKNQEEELFDGWMKLTLYYPSNATEKMWRLGTEGEVRSDDSLNWEEYTGSITIPLSRVDDVWIKYKVNKEQVVVPPAGRVLVNIETSPNGTLSKKVNVTIHYDKNATTKEYRVGNSDWISYTGNFEVSENVMIEARAIKDDSVYDSDGKKILTRTAVGRDYYYVGNIGVEETSLEAPTITRINPSSDNEVARVRITYPEAASKKVYKINYGVEETYNEEVPITKYGSYVLAYYYDASGKRSKTRGIYINDTSSGGSPSVPEEVVILPPRGKDEPIPVTPTYQIKAPTITITPSSITDKVKVKVDAGASANNVYLKLGTGNYQPYTGEVIVTENMNVSAYYLTYQGERSDTAYGRVSNIKQGNLPYLAIQAEPYPYSSSMGEKSVKVSIQSSDATKVEYSFNGIEYEPYTGEFTVTKNTRVYGRAINTNGVKEAYLDITNIGNLVPPKKKDVLDVSITAVPDPSVTKTKVDKVTIKINYDSRASKKYYATTKGGELIPYTGEFEITKNTTIYAYAVSENGSGEASKQIDIITSGIAEPVIEASPRTQEASKVKISIVYDQSASTKQYRVGGGSLRDYTGTFEVTENSTIYAYSSNGKGETSSSSYQVRNIVGKNQVLILDKGDYFLLKLNYPEGSKGQEYKFKESGNWNSYKDDGILLVKAQYKDKVISGDKVAVKIETETGEKINFNGDFYILDVPVSQIFENLFLRWDRVTPTSPQIVPNTIEPAKEVGITIFYEKSLVLKQYKLIHSNGELLEDWTNYQGVISVQENNVTIVARGKDEAEVWSGESRYQVTNIDEQSPVIELTADYENPTRQLGIKVKVTDDVKVNQVKWAKGVKGVSYFKSEGTVISNESIVTITENDYYTFYASDYAGNEQIYTVNINNIDLTPPEIEITVDPVSAIGTSVTVSIDYGKSTTKQYKIGNSTTWVSYTGPFTIDSNTVITNKLGNSDKSLTIYAKGKDSAGNDTTETYKLVNLDLDVPTTPVINATSGYPMLTGYGVEYNTMTSITYDTRNDIRNYYSLDGGTTWLEYKGEFKLTTGTIKAKSVKNSTGLEVSSSKTVSLPSDALGVAAYDGNNATYVSNPSKAGYIKVDPSMWEKKIYIYSYKYNRNNDNKFDFLDKNKTRISLAVDAYLNGTISTILTIPKGTEWIAYSTSYSENKLYEIASATEPTFTAESGYMLLHADSSKAITSPYQMVTINYVATSVERLYRIGTTGEWKNYQDQPIKVNQGETIYAKGIDQYGAETRITSSYTANVSDAVGAAAYDGNNATYVSQNNSYLKVDPSMWGKKIFIYSYKNYYNNNSKFDFLDKNKTLISRITDTEQTGNISTIVTVPNGAEWILYNKVYDVNRLYEITPLNEPQFSAENGYMLLHADSAKAIKNPYQMITINYFVTSVDRLYKIGASGEWQNYQDQPIKVNQGEVIYAKGVDQYGIETRITSSYISNSTDALLKEAYDGDISTASYGNNKIIRVDDSMQGQKVYIKGGAALKNDNMTFYIDFLNEQKGIINSLSAYNWHSVTLEGTYTIPVGTRYIRQRATVTNTYLYEIRPA